MISHLILIAIPTIAIICIYGTTLKDIIYTDTIAQEQALSDQTAQALNSTLEQIPKISSAIQESNLIKNLTDDSFYYSDSSVPYQFYEDLTAFQQLVALQTEGDFITNVRVYADNLPSSWYSSDAEETFFEPLNNSLGTYWRGIFTGTDTTELYCPNFYLSSTESANLGDLAYIVEIPTSSEEHTVIYLALYFSETELSTLLSQNTSNNEGITYIINERNSIVTSSDYKTTGTYVLDYEEVVATSSSYDRFITMEVLGEEVYAGCYYISGTDWYMVSILPTEPMINKGLLLIIQFVVLYSLMIGIAFYIANKLSHSITTRIKSLRDAMGSVLNGPPKKMEVSEILDEVGGLINTYNYMSDEMNSLLSAQAKAADDLRIAEFNALQAQINPHFLYNTMDMINWLSQTGQNKEVTEAVQSLSKFYKITLSRKKPLTTIENEIEHVSLYVKLQNMRYENKIDLIIDIPDELMPYEIPKLTFQPVVENAIIHGILEKDSREGSIVITGWIEDDSIVILISDDGMGIQPEDLATILDGTKTNNNRQGTNIGIYNTHERLKMLYGQDAGLTYHSTPNVGTEVEIRLSAIPKN